MSETPTERRARVDALTKRTGKVHLYLESYPEFPTLASGWLWDAPLGLRRQGVGGQVWEWMDYMDARHCSRTRSTT